MVDEDVKRPPTGPLITVATVLGIIAVVGYMSVIHTAPATWAAVLFALSIALDWLILRRQIPDSRIATELAVCEVVKFILLLCYTLFESEVIESEQVACGLAYASLLTGMFITYAMVIFAGNMIRNAPKEGASNWLSSTGELLSDKVLALTAVVIAFLHVTYCLTFALAFSDRFGPRPHDLYATSEGIENDEEAKAPESAKDAPLCDTPRESLDRVRKIFFLESAATLTCTEGLREAAKNSKNLRTKLCEDGIESRIDAFSSVAAASCDQPVANTLQRRAAIWNLSELYALCSLFHQIAVDKKTGRTYLIEIRGHANDTRLKSDPVLPYGSNYEISKQRADQVENLVRKVFEDATHDVEAPAVRWLTYGVSNEPSFLEAGVPADARPLDPKLSVELQIQEVGDSFEDRRLRSVQSDRRDLELLDYLYFTTYTITTTGYGDITPISPYAKAVVTLANLIELLFVVVLVNVIANTRPSGKGDEDASPAA